MCHMGPILSEAMQMSFLFHLRTETTEGLEPKELRFILIGLKYKEKYRIDIFVKV